MSYKGKANADDTEYDRINAVKQRENKQLQPNSEETDVWYSGAKTDYIPHFQIDLKSNTWSS